jgi:hypothetical protein
MPLAVAAAMVSEDRTVASILWLRSATSWDASAPTATKVTLFGLMPLSCRTYWANVSVEAPSAVTPIVLPTSDLRLVTPLPSGVTIARSSRP